MVNNKWGSQSSNSIDTQWQNEHVVQLLACVTQGWRVISTRSSSQSPVIRDEEAILIPWKREGRNVNWTNSLLWSKVPKEIWSDFIRTQLTEETLRGDLFTMLLKARDSATLPSKQQRTECFKANTLIPSLTTSFSLGINTSVYGQHC